MQDDILRKLERLQSLDGTVHNSDKSNIHWPKSVDPAPTKEEAIARARVESIKKGKHFTEKKGTDIQKAEDDAVERYVDDLLNRLL